MIIYIDKEDHVYNTTWRMKYLCICTDMIENWEVLIPPNKTHRLRLPSYKQKLNEEISVYHGVLLSYEHEKIGKK